MAGSPDGLSGPLMTGGCAGAASGAGIRFCRARIPEPANGEACAPMPAPRPMPCPRCAKAGVDKRATAQSAMKKRCFMIEFLITRMIAPRVNHQAGEQDARWPVAGCMARMRKPAMGVHAEIGRAHV